MKKRKIKPPPHIYIYYKPDTIRLFPDVTAYNAASNCYRYPLPDFMANKSYFIIEGNDGRPQLPQAITEEDAKDFILASAAFKDFLRKPVSAWKNIEEAVCRENFLHDESFTLARRLRDKIAGQPSFIRGQLSLYLALVLCQNGIEGDNLKATLQDLGIAMIPRARHKHSNEQKFNYEPLDTVSNLQLAENIQNVPHASYLGFLICYCNSVATRYSLPQLYLVGDAIEVCMQTMPDQYDDFCVIREVYQRTNLARAIDRMRSLAMREHGKPSP